MGVLTCERSRIETRGHGDVSLKQAGDGTFGLGRERRTHEVRLGDIRDARAHVEIDTSERPPCRQVFQDCSRGGFDALRVEAGQPEFIREGHGKTTTQRRGDQFVGIGAPAFREAGAKRILRFGKNPAFRTHCAGAFSQAALPDD